MSSSHDPHISGQCHPMPNATASERPQDGPGRGRSDSGTASTSEALLGTNVNPGNGIPAPLPIPGRNGIPIYAIVHGACRKWWTGTERSHCGGCHELFSGLTA